MRYVVAVKLASCRYSMKKSLTICIVSLHYTVTVYLSFKPYCMNNANVIWNPKVGSHLYIVYSKTSLPCTSRGLRNDFDLSGISS